MITKLTVILFLSWLGLTVFVIPKHLNQRGCTHMYAQGITRLQLVAFQDDGADTFRPCYTDGALSAYRKLLIITWFCLLVAWPSALVQDVYRWFRRKRASATS